jgi:hypothetical protein
MGAALFTALSQSFSRAPRTRKPPRLPPLPRARLLCLTYGPSLRAVTSTRDRGAKLEVHTRQGVPFKLSDLRKV